MKIRVIRTLVIVSCALFAAGCEIVPNDWCEIDCEIDEALMVESGAVRLGPEEVMAYVSGKTEQWVHGGAYYHDSGRLEVKWRKVNYKTFWEVGADGTLCYQLDTWGRRCHFYMKKDEEIYMLEEGINIGARDIYDGNRLQNIKGYSPPPESLRQTFWFKTNPLSD